MSASQLLIVRDALAWHASPSGWKSHCVGCHCRSACALVPYSASALAAMKAGATSSSLFDTCSSLSIRYTADTTTAGSYLFVVRAYDNAQNTGQSSIYNVQVSGALQAACCAGLLLVSLLVALVLLL